MNDAVRNMGPDEWLSQGRDDFITREANEPWAFSDDPALSEMLAKARTVNAKRHQVVASLAELRRTVGLTQTHVARIWGRAQSQVSRIENNPTSGELATIASYVAALGGHVILEAEIAGTIYRVDLV